MGVAPLHFYWLEKCLLFLCGGTMKTQVWKCSIIFVMAALFLTSCTQDKQKKDKDTGKKDTPEIEGEIVEGTYNKELETIIADSFCYEIQEDIAVLTEVYQYRETEVLPGGLKYEGKEYSIEKIGDNAFQDASVLRVITLPKGLKEIGTEAFYGCDNIEEITIPDAVQKIGTSVFFNCERLKKVTFGNGVDAVSDEMFSNCYALSEVVFPKKLQHIGTESFWACESLKQMTLPSDIVNVGSRAFYGSGIETMEICSDTLKPEKDVFEGMSQLQSLTVPEKRREDYKLLDTLSQINITGK